MAYELHIERENGEIGLDEWKAAIAQTKDVRLCSSDHSITNPKTGEVITLPLRDGDAEVYFPEDRAWNAAFQWFEGGASFRAMLLPKTRLIRFGKRRRRWLSG